MAKIEKYTCDMCGAEKKEANHWFRVFVFPASVKDGQAIYIVPWMSPYMPALIYTKADKTEPLQRFRDERHVCGEKCLHSAVSVWAS